MTGIKRLIIFAVTLCMLLFCAACAPQAESAPPPDGAVVAPEKPDDGSDTPDNPDNPVKPNGGVLVAYFSYSGNTETVAEYIARYSGGTPVEIVAKQAYTPDDVDYNDYGSRCQTERRTDARPEIADETYDGIDIDEYATVIIGYPIWNGEEPMIIRTFIEHYAQLKGKTVYTFSTSGSTTPAALNAAMRARYSEIGFAGNLHFTRGTLANAERQVREWVKETGLSESDAEEPQSENIMYVKVNGEILTAELADNSTARALLAELALRDITVEMSDYGGFEKVGTPGVSLPRNDEYIRTEAGDLIWYSGQTFVIYYDTNAYTFTRLGKLKNVTAARLKSILGDGDVSVTLSLHK